MSLGCNKKTGEATTRKKPEEGQTTMIRLSVLPSISNYLLLS